ncbi:hypothetical protein LRN56_16265, partial [Staphylococcus aureus]|nr:hypothetical protein [Staphylococcus aureus]
MTERPTPVNFDDAGAIRAIPACAAPGRLRQLDIVHIAGRVIAAEHGTADIVEQRGFRYMFG